MDYIKNWLEQNEDAVLETAKYIFDHPEGSMEERKSAAKAAEFLKNQGFTIEFGTAGLETAFTASYGEGKPVYGFLAEYDALPGLGQDVVPYRSEKPGFGHGCGHHLLGMGIIAAACAFKEELEKNHKPGTIRVYGCPAEEILYGKVVMAEAGIFDDLSVAISLSLKHIYSEKLGCRDYK